MIVPNSVVEDLLTAIPQLRPQIYFKSSLTALSHAMEDQVLAGTDKPLIIASFQRERFYKQEAHRYSRIATRTKQVYVMAAPETDFTNRSGDYETIAFEPEDPLSQEWHLVVLGKQYACCLICKEKVVPDTKTKPTALHVDQARRFEGIWTFDRPVVCKAADLLLRRILIYRPELATKTGRALGRLVKEINLDLSPKANPEPFAERLVTYLQAGQYKLSKAYRSIAEKEQRERLLNSMTATIRRSLDPQEILQLATRELGQVLNPGRCLIYRCKATDTVVRLEHEFLDPASLDIDIVDDSSIPSLTGMLWDLSVNLLFQRVVEQRESVYVEDLQTEMNLQTFSGSTTLQQLIQTGKIRTWLMVPVINQERLLGVIELHYAVPRQLVKSELELVEAIASQLGVALIQAEAYANLEDLNQQLAALDRTRSNLIAITGHELRTPLSTIQVCLESLATDPDMPTELRQVMLNSALTDAERMRKLIQDFLTLSRLESGRVEWRLEPQPLQECVDLALSSLRAHYSTGLPAIQVYLPEPLPLVRVDGEWLVEVLSKLLDNACKFTASNGSVQIHAHQLAAVAQLEVVIADTGRGIEPNRLETVFERFYQEEGALRRSTGGTGLGLAICRQIISGWGGRIWAESEGKDRGCQFHFTIPTVLDV
ncbi:MAG: DICT sensory domain-containing protein [Synechococcales bacterium]|nr:DICT sensory domain-containing protein [Synechococcales bacterium]